MNYADWFKGLPKFEDLRGKLPHRGEYARLPLSKKTHIALHHSLTKTGTPLAFAKYHVYTNKWPEIAYPLVIGLDGTLYLCLDLDKKSYHAGNSNSFALGICLVGDFRKGSGQTPTMAQKQTLHETVEILLKNIPSIKAVQKHQELPGYGWKNCSGDGWDYREVIKNERYDLTPPKSTAASTFEYHVVQEGDTLWSIAKGVKGLDVKGILALNPGLEPTRLQIGSKVYIKKISKPAPTATKRKYVLPFATLKRGAKGPEVKLLQTALNAMYFKCGVVDGGLGPKTEDALVRFYKVNDALNVRKVYDSKAKALMEKKLP